MTTCFDFSKKRIETQLSKAGILTSDIWWLEVDGQEFDLHLTQHSGNATCELAVVTGAPTLELTEANRPVLEMLLRQHLIRIPESKRCSLYLLAQSRGRLEAWVSKTEKYIVAFDVAAREDSWSLRYLARELSKRVPGPIKMSSYFRGDMEDLAFYKPTLMKLNSNVYDIDHWKDMVHHCARLALRRGVSVFILRETGLGIVPSSVHDYGEKGYWGLKTHPYSIQSRDANASWMLACKICQHLGLELEVAVRPVPRNRSQGRS